MIPFTDANGLRDYRAHVAPTSHAPRVQRWPWLVLLLCLVGLALRAWR